MYHISDVKKFNRCPLLFLNDYTSKNTKYEPYVRLDETVSTLVVDKLKIDYYFLGERNDPKERVLEVLDQYEWFVKARFEYKELRVKVPFLHKTDKGYDVYFLFVGLYPRADDLQLYTDTIWVLEGNNLEINDIKMIHLNADYVRQEELDVNELFIISDYFYTDNHHPKILVKDAIESHMIDLTHTLKKMNATTYDTIDQPARSAKCFGRVKCRHFDTCFKSELVPDNSVLNLIGSRYRYDMDTEGRKTLKEADIEKIEGTRIQYAQIMADYNGGLFIDRLAMKAWLENVTFPITFLDFEWERFAIPPYFGMKPYDVLPFEYSIHIMDEDGTLSHKCFLSIHDDRKEFAKRLIEDVPKEGTIFAFNAVGAEIIRIQELANQFPKYKEDLLNLNKRMKDLQFPFEVGLVYDTRMNGSWSLKAIMNMLDDKGYNDLNIAQGMDAVYQWRILDREEDDPRTKEIIEELKEYCSMDTYAMSVVYRWLLGFIQNQEVV